MHQESEENDYFFRSLAAELRNDLFFPRNSQVFQGIEFSPENHIFYGKNKVPRKPLMG